MALQLSGKRFRCPEKLVEPAEERHVFIPVRYGGVPAEVLLYLTDSDESELPPRPKRAPILPSPVYSCVGNKRVRKPRAVLGRLAVANVSRSNTNTLGGETGRSQPTLMIGRRD